MFGGSDCKESACKSGNPGLGVSPGEADDNPLQYSCSQTEKPGGLQSMVSQRVIYNYATNTFTFNHIAMANIQSVHNGKDVPVGLWNYWNVFLWKIIINLTLSPCPLLYSQSFPQCINRSTPIQKWKDYYLAQQDLAEACSSTQA